MEATGCNQIAEFQDAGTVTGASMKIRSFLKESRERSPHRQSARERFQPKQHYTSLPRTTVNWRPLPVQSRKAPPVPASRLFFHARSSQYSKTIMEKEKHEHWLTRIHEWEPISSRATEHAGRNLLEQKLHGQLSASPTQPDLPARLRI